MDAGYTNINDLEKIKSIAFHCVNGDRWELDVETYEFQMAPGYNVFIATNRKNNNMVIVNLMNVSTIVMTPKEGYFWTK